MNHSNKHATSVILLALGLLVACTPATVAPTAEPIVEATLPPIVEPTATFETVHLNVGIFNYVSYAPIFIAFEEGYFSEVGLEVELFDFGSQSSEMVPALLNGQLDVTPYPFSAAIFNPILEGVQVAYVADKGFLNPDSCVTDAFVASNVNLEDGSLTDEASLAGKSIVSFPGGVMEYSLDTLLARGGLTQADITIQAVMDSAARIEALDTGAVTLSVLSEPWITRAQSQEAGTVWMPLSDLLPGMSMGAMIYGPSMLERDPEVGIRFMMAYLKAIDQFNEGKTERNLEIIAQYTQLAPDEIMASCMTSFKPDGKIEDGALMDFMEWSLAKGYIDSALTIDQMLNHSFVEEAYARLHE